MADNTRSANVVSQTYTFGDRRFIGINTNIQANNLEDGYVQDAINVWNDGGALVTRPGWQAQLTSLTGLTSSYEPIAYRQADNSSNFIIYAEGTAGGTTANIRKFVTGATTTTLLGTVTADPAKVRMVQFGKYVYGVPGQGGGNVFRTDGTTLDVVPTVKPAYKNGDDLITPQATPLTAAIRPIAQVATSVTFAASNSTITSTNTFVANEPIVFVASLDTVLLANTVYYVRATGLSGSSFSVSATAGGAALTPTTSATYNAFSLRGIDNALSTGFDPVFVSSPVATSAVTFATSGPAPVTCATDVSTFVGVGSTVTFTTTGALPTNITAGVTYYVRSISGTAISIAVAPTGALLTPATTGSPTTTATFSNAGEAELITNTVTTTGYTFESDTSGSNPSTTFWTSSGSPTVKTISSSGSNWYGGSGKIISYDAGTKSLLLDKGTDAIESFNKVVPSFSFNNQTRKAALFLFKCVMFNNDSLTAPRNQSVRITVTGKDSANAAIPGAVFTQNISPAVATSTNDWKAISVVVDFRAWASSISKVSVRLSVGNPAQTTGSDQGIFVDNICFYSIVDHVVPDLSNALDSQNLVTIRAKQVNASVSPLAAGYIKGASLRFSSITKTDFSKEDTISLRMDFPTAIKTNLPFLSLGLQNTGATSPEWTGYGIYDPDKGYMTWKIYGISQSKRNNIQYMYVRCETEYPDVINNSILFSIGELVSNGNLTPDTDYEYTFTRWYSSDQTNLRPPTFHEGNVYQTGLETLPCNASNSIRTTAAYSRASVILNPQINPATDLQWDTYPLVVSATPSEFVTDTLPAANQLSVISASAGTLTYTDSNGTAGRTIVLTANVPAVLSFAIKNVTAFTGTTPVWLRHNPTYTTSATFKYSHVLVYRRANGVFPDGRFRLVAVVPISASSSGTNWTSTVTSVTTSGTWNEITFFDNVPDGDLFYEGAPYSQGHFFEPGRDQFPNGCTSLAIHQKRLWVSKGNTVYGSWVLNFGNEYSLYTTIVPDGSDLNYAAKGTSFTLSSTFDNEKIVTLLSYGGDQMFFNNSSTAAMLVIRERSIYPLLGWDPSNFTIQSMITEASTGCISPRAAMSVFGRLMWQSPIGVVEFANGNIAQRSIELRKMLSMDKATGAPDLTAASYRGISYAIHNGRLFVFAPGVGDSVNTYVYVYDTRTNGWTRWRSIPTTSTYGTVPSTFQGFTGGVSMSFGNDTADFYALGTNGQIYKLASTVDMQTTTLTNPIYWSLTSRQYGQTYSEGIAYYNQNKVSQLNCHMFTGTGVTGVTGNFSGPTVTATNTFKANDLVRLSKNVVTNATENTYYLVSSATGSSFVVKNLDNSAISSAVTGSITAEHGFAFGWAVQDESGINKHGTGTWYVPINFNRTFAIRSLNRNTLATVMQINLYGWSNTANRLYASHIHCADARIARSL
jgi:hypothetical protein